MALPRMENFSLDDKRHSVVEWNFDSVERENFRRRRSEVHTSSIALLPGEQLDAEKNYR
jgi:hypothetical protein